MGELETIKTDLRSFDTQKAKSAAAMRDLHELVDKHAGFLDDVKAKKSKLDEDAGAEVFMERGGELADDIVLGGPAFESFLRLKDSAYHASAIADQAALGYFNFWKPPSQWTMISSPSAASLLWATVPASSVLESANPQGQKPEGQQHNHKGTDDRGDSSGT